MKWSYRIVLAAVFVFPAFCQEPPAAPPAPPAAVPLEDRIMSLADQSAAIAERAAAAADRADALNDKQVKAMELLSSDRLAQIDDTIARIQSQFDSGKITELESAAERLAGKFDLAFLQKPIPVPAPAAPPAPPASPKVFTTLGRSNWNDSAYDKGTSALDQHRYDDAVQIFDSVINAKSTRSDGALYWKAYALNRLGKRDDALAALAQLRRDFATSAWLNDAQALEAEVRQNAGQPVSPAQETNEDLKLMAINSLMNADAERAIPLVEGILKGSSTPAVKKRALFVLAQSKSPRAQQALGEYAKGGGNPDLQLNAIQYVGMSATKESQQQLAGIYAASSDSKVKNAVLQSLMMARANDVLLNIAKTEKDPALKSAAIRYLSASRVVPVDGLLELYNSGADAPTKREIIDGFTARRDAKTLVDLARKESDLAVKETIVERLSTMHDNKEAMDYMMELLK
jgi:TolA-binding protein